MNTIVETLLGVEGRLHALREKEDGRAAREFSLALTSLENVVMRVNRGFALASDRFSVSDVERSLLGNVCAACGSGEAEPDLGPEDLFAAEDLVADERERRALLEAVARQVSFLIGPGSVIVTNDPTGTSRKVVDLRANLELLGVL